MQHAAPLKLLASAILILNLLDAIFTLTYTQSGLATESNAMMYGPLAASPTIFILAKITLVSLCVLLLSRVGPRKAALVGLVGATTALHRRRSLSPQRRADARRVAVTG